MADWQRGDMALCINSKGWYARFDNGLITSADGPCSGQVCTVTAVNSTTFGLCLQFVEFPQFHTQDNGYLAQYFRKITPGADIEGIEERRRIPECV